MRQGYRQKLIDELREHVKNAAPFGLTFSPCPGMSDVNRKRLEEHLRGRFHQWADTWVHPWINEIERHWLKKPAKAK